MPTQQLEKWVRPITGYSALSEGNGGFVGYAAVFYELNCYDAILLPGAFTKTISQFLSKGFTAQQHDWDFAEAIGYPTAAREDDTGLLTSMAYHSTPDAQMIRAKVNERIEAGLDVGLSIGFFITADSWISSKDFESELPKYMPLEKVRLCLDQLKYHADVHLIHEVELCEYSIVTAPANPSAGVIHGYSASRPDGEHFVEQLENTLGVCGVAVSRLEAVAERRKAIDAQPERGLFAGKKHSAATVEKINAIDAHASEVISRLNDVRTMCSDMIANPGGGDSAIESDSKEALSAGMIVARMAAYRTQAELAKAVVGL